MKKQTKEPNFDMPLKIRYNTEKYADNAMVAVECHHGTVVYREFVLSEQLFKLLTGQTEFRISPRDVGKKDAKLQLVEKRQ